MEHHYRIFPWSVGYNPKEEKSKAAVWISLPNLLPDLFTSKPLMSIAAAVGRPIAIDKATQPRPSTARVKVILDLLGKHPEKVRLQYIDVTTGKILEDFQSIVYENLPAYCCHCKHQGHEEAQCRVLKGKTMKTAQIGYETFEGGDQATEKLQGDARDFLNAKKQIKIALSKATEVPDDDTLDMADHEHEA